VDKQQAPAVAYDWNTDNYYQRAHLRLRAISTLLRARFPEPHGVGVLDIGCGQAALGKLLGEGFDYCGCDGYSGVFDRAGQAATVEKWVYDERAPALPFGDTTFDAIVCSGFVEYVTNRAEFFALVRKRLKPGGIFIVSLVNFFRWDRQLAFAATRLGLPRTRFIHEQWRAPIALTGFMDLLDSAGLPVDAGIPLPFHTPDGQSRTLPMLTAAQLRARWRTVQRHFETQVIFVAGAPAAAPTPTQIVVP